MTVLEAPEIDPLDTLHPLQYEGEEYHCPTTGFRLYKNYKRNIRMREQMVVRCGRSEEAQKALWEACQKSIIVWLNLFGWTYRLRAIDDSGKPAKPKYRNQAFITWPCQDTALNELVSAVQNGHDVIIDKSRDMGASWLVVALATWLWLFHGDTHSILASEKEDKVDKPGDPDTLYFKVNFLLHWLPGWMLPCKVEDLEKGGKHRQHLQLTNPANNSTITGAAMTAHIGRGGRRDFVLFDEMAAMPQATEAWQAAADTTDCRIGNSTPIGAGTEYSDQYFNATKHDYPALVGLYYYDHPEKGNGRERICDHDGHYTNESGRWFWWTPWLEHERTTRRGPRDMAQNILADHVMSGESFFNTRAITAHIQDYTREPKNYRLVAQEGAAGRTKAYFIESKQGPWRLWCELDGQGKPAFQNTNYVMFADPSYGKGAANAALMVMDRESGMVVGEYADPNTPPQDLAYEMCIAGKHCFRGQSKGAFIGWETNGPGESIYRDVLRMDYPFIYYQRSAGQRGEPRTKRYGWHSGHKEKELLCSELDKALVREEITVPSRDCLNEMLDYTFYDNGSIGPGHLRDEYTGARAAHGDRCIALAGCVLLRREAPKFQPIPASYRPEQLGAIAEHWRIEAEDDEAFSDLEVGYS